MNHVERPTVVSCATRDWFDRSTDGLITFRFIFSFSQARKKKSTISDFSNWKTFTLSANDFKNLCHLRLGIHKDPLHSSILHLFSAHFCGGSIIFKVCSNRAATVTQKVKINPTNSCWCSGNAGITNSSTHYVFPAHFFARYTSQSLIQRTKSQVIRVAHPLDTQQSRIFLYDIYFFHKNVSLIAFSDSLGFTLTQPFA